jgi:protein kinase C substrate 80K-H
MSGENESSALAGFYCKNKGHRPAYIPFTLVNDGICDYDLCCDGSDEWQGVGGVKCADKCKEIGKEYKKKDAERNRATTAGYKKRKELDTQARKLKSEVENRVGILESEIGAAESKVKELSDRLAEVERLESGRIVKGPSKGGVLASLAKDRIEELRGKLFIVKEQRDQSRKKVEELENLLKTFKDEYNPNFNDEGVKRAVRNWEDYVANVDAGEGSESDHETIEKDIDALVNEEYGGINWEDFEFPSSDDPSDIEVCKSRLETSIDAERANELYLVYQFEAYLPVALRTWVDQKLRELRVVLVENGILAAPSSTPDASDSKAVIDAKAALATAETSVADKRTELSDKKKDLEEDYGFGGIFRALRGTCVSKTSGEYTYEVCWMERTTQKPMKGGSDTGMGNFVKFDEVTVDDIMPPDGKGLGSGLRVGMRYENGQSCWNGPQRSTLVVLGCAEKDEIWKVTEEEKCVYRMEVGTPAVCEGGSAESVNDAGVKDEL